MKRWLKIIIVGVLLVIAVLVQKSETVAQALAAASRPFLKGLDAIGGAVEHSIGYMPLGKSRQREFEELKRKNAELELQLDRQRVFRRQNEGLRELLKLRLPPEWNRIHAAIIARDPVTWHRRFRIGKGRADGIRLGAAVMKRQYVIGRVTEVAAHSATVSTLADRDCRVSVRLADQGGVGVLAGAAGEQRDGEPICIITYLPRTYNFKSGELILTSGLSEVIPPGLVVGRTVPWDQANPVNLSQGTFARIKFHPAASFEHFRFVTVISRENHYAQPSGARADISTGGYR